MPEEAPVTSAAPLVPVLLISALLRVRESASFSRSSAMRSRASQIAGLPARSANSRYHAARSRSLFVCSMREHGCSSGSAALGAGPFTDLSAMNCILLDWKRYRGIQKPRHVSDEQRGILVLRPVIGIRIEDELRVRQVLLQDERVYGVDDHVIAAVHDQSRLFDCL